LVGINATLITPASGTIGVNITKSNVQYEFQSGATNKKFNYLFTEVGTFKVTADYDGNGNYNEGSVSLNVYVEEISMPPSTPGAGENGGEEIATLSAGCAEIWVCSGWSVCADGMQTRTCADTNNCGTAVSKPPVEQSCSLIQENETAQSQGEKPAPDIIKAILEGCSVKWEFLAASLLAFAMYGVSVSVAIRKKKAQWLIISAESLAAVAAIIAYSYLNCIKSVFYPVIAGVIAVLIPAGLWLVNNLNALKNLLKRIRKTKER